MELKDYSIWYESGRVDLPPQNIVVLFEGTGNTLKDGNSNVARVLAELRQVKTRHLQPRPLTYDGIGTSGFILDKLYHSAVGDEALKILLKSYLDTSRRILRAIKENQNYHLFIFGFSRGAMLARALAYLLTHYGASASRTTVRRLFENFKAGQLPESPFRRNGDSATASLKVEVHYLGLWDTVNSTNCISSNLLTQPLDVRYVRHAIAIDEHRPTYDYVPFVPGHCRDVKEYFFVGSHSDVGGCRERGYCQPLGDVAFAWVMNGAIYRGLFAKKPMYSEVLDLSGDIFVHKTSKKLEGLKGDIVRLTDPRFYHISALANQALGRNALSLEEASFLASTSCNLVRRLVSLDQLFGRKSKENLRQHLHLLFDGEELKRRFGACGPEGKVAVPSGVEPKIVVTADVGEIGVGKSRRAAPGKNHLRLSLANFGKQSAFFVHFKAKPPIVNYSYAPECRFPASVGELFGCRSVVLDLGDVRAFCKENPDLRQGNRDVRIAGTVCYFTLDAVYCESPFSVSLKIDETHLEGRWSYRTCHKALVDHDLYSWCFYRSLANARRQEDIRRQGEGFAEFLPQLPSDDDAAG